MILLLVKEKKIVYLHLLKRVISSVGLQNRKKKKEKALLTYLYSIIYFKNY